ncbi:tRNA (5-methylaminomethyl-2-thiouridine)(34)-methyltransferase MnmD [Flavobacterium capsici]|uniref:tRNA (5-methylaminomethyl-2-thiouridine)(34)-methyltransferase MnmD n=1 Tax=Flavobacterium capsici TaxID=3075618 RepID=A0AA96ET73_9FLAO|nr:MULTISPECIES: tRNA (5-methylaminomethyl-2-thiouridine)(34)-methyltransferase MnmD [unclassified Flavobacterium]WNM18003.1 tRNA (5-methylaminomethyl-2-thiouridine)(34)-methyltransferase MnmD [Flavobacterium sp. PMR2A8]WNM22055.1 tRNA (5-methylaminomethyl-2-thiouridine)(34)-methyltransferase MnmD [Flavobacterium sp. PMTSA4]
MKREIIETKDGSTSIYLPELNETYHSKHGAIQEANHVFIKNGFSLFEGKPISILEIGLGTGLNALITFNEAQKLKNQIEYVGVEAYPVSMEDALKMNYVAALNPSLEPIYLKIHQSDWETTTNLSDNFSFLKRKQFFEDINDKEAFDLIYFDAFGFDVQPNLWTKAIFETLFNALRNDGILVTYACRSIIKNNMIEAGFKVEKLPGAPGKREMLRAKKE